MRMAYIMFDQMTTMDFAGFYEVVAWMGVLGKKENLSWDFCSNKEEITDDRGMKIKIQHVDTIQNLLHGFKRHAT